MSRLNSKSAFAAAVGLTILVGTTGQAHAGAFGWAEIGYDNALLSNFNLVTLGDYKSTVLPNSYATTQGRTIIGGNATAPNGGGAAFCTASNCTGATVAVDSSKQLYGAATIFGNVAFNQTYLAAGYNASGNTLAIGGTASGYIYAGNKTDVSIRGSATGLIVNTANNIRTSQTTYAGTTAGTQTGVTTAKVSAATVFPYTLSGITSEVNNLSLGLTSLPGTVKQKLTVGDGIFFTAAADYTNVGKNYGVITTTMADLAAETNFKGIDNGTNDATFVIVTGDGANYTLPNLGSYAGSSKVIFDFVDAKILNFAGNWSGSILAPLATINSMGGTIDGSVIVNSINQSQALYATNLFNGDLSGLVPEPASIALFGAGLVALAVARARRKS